MGQGPQAVSITKFSFEFSNFQEKIWNSTLYPKSKKTLWSKIIASM